MRFEPCKVRLSVWNWSTLRRQLFFGIHGIIAFLVVTYCLLESCVSLQLFAVSTFPLPELERVTPMIAMIAAAAAWHRATSALGALPREGFGAGRTGFQMPADSCLRLATTSSICAPFGAPWPVLGPSRHDAMRPAPAVGAKAGFFATVARLGLPELQTWFCVPRCASRWFATVTLAVYNRQPHCGKGEFVEKQ
jgi:hypothetical protein